VVNELVGHLGQRAVQIVDDWQQCAHCLLLAAAPFFDAFALGSPFEVQKIRALTLE
jgi:hypothetical protein